MVMLYVCGYQMPARCSAPEILLRQVQEREGAKNSSFTWIPLDLMSPAWLFLRLAPAAGAGKVGTARGDGGEASVVQGECGIERRGEGRGRSAVQ